MRKIREFILKHFEEAIVALIFFGILAIAFLVHYKFSFLNFFFLPVILSGYFLGKKKAVLTGSLCILLVIIYLIFINTISDPEAQLSFDEVINLLTWASFLILTAAIIGVASEQRESKIKNMRRAYIGVLDILLKYLEVADDERPRSLRVSLLAGKIASAANLKPREVENIKSAALLYDAGDLQSSISLFDEVADFIKSDIKISETQVGDREKVMLKTTASLLKEIEPILTGYFHNYVKEGDKLSKNLEEIPVGSSIIALADLYVKVLTHTPFRLGGEEIKSLRDIEKLMGRTFPSSAVEALQKAISTGSLQ